MSLFGGLFGGSNANSKAGDNAASAIYAGSNAGSQALQDWAKAAKTNFDYNPWTAYTANGTKSSNMFANALGLNGQSGNDAATSAFHTNPGYQFQLNQGLQSIDRNNAASGLYGSGNNAAALTQYATGLADQSYNNWLSSLSTMTNQGLAGAAGQQQRENAMAGIDMTTGLGINQNLTTAAQQAAGYQFKGQTADAAQNAQGGANLFSTILGGLNLGGKLMSGGGLFS